MGKLLVIFKQRCNDIDNLVIQKNVVNFQSILKIEGGWTWFSHLIFFGFYFLREKDNDINLVQVLTSKNTNVNTSSL